MDYIKYNEVLYFYCNELENFKFLNNKTTEKAFKNQSSFNLKKIRILSNQILKVGIEQSKFIDNNNNEDNKIKEINFFGLLLKLSKDFLTPSYNLIIHLNGGGCFSQSSESHLLYLKK